VGLIEHVGLADDGGFRPLPPCPQAAAEARRQPPSLRAGDDPPRICSGSSSGSSRTRVAVVEREINGWSEALRVELQPDIRVTVIEPGAIGTELANHITHADSKKAAEEATAEIGIPAQDIADVITFAVSRPQRVTLNEILVRPTAQPM
jgi:NAD(P)-dependent dehydrogenase (short-subunit alcohol dehydrogenase family)